MRHTFNSWFCYIVQTRVCLPKQSSLHYIESTSRYFTQLKCERKIDLLQNSPVVKLKKTKLIYFSTLFRKIKYKRLDVYTYYKQDVSVNEIEPVASIDLSIAYFSISCYILAYQMKAFLNCWKTDKPRMSFFSSSRRYSAN